MEGAQNLNKLQRYFIGTQQNRPSIREDPSAWDGL